MIRLVGNIGNKGKDFSPFLYISHENINLVGNVGNIGNYFSPFLLFLTKILSS